MLDEVAINSKVRDEFKRSIVGILESTVDEDRLDESTMGDLANKIITTTGMILSGSGALMAAFGGDIKTAAVIGIGGMASSKLAGHVAKIAIEKKQFKGLYDSLISVTDKRDSILKLIIKAPVEEQSSVLNTNRGTLKKLTAQQQNIGARMKAFLNDPSNSKVLSKVPESDLANLEVIIEIAEMGRATSIEKEIARINRSLVATR